METLLKQSLLLTHGTIYGHINSAQAWIDHQYNSTNINTWGSYTFWLTNIPYKMPPSLALTEGTLTDNSPIDFINWTAGTGEEATDILNPYEQCLALLTRF